MASINSVTESEKFESFKKHLRDGDVKGVRETVEPGFVDEILDDGRKPIHWACEKGHFEIVKLLIEKKCNVESQNFWLRRPIHLLCKNGHFELLKLLIEKKCNIESGDNLERRPIHLACEKGHFNTVKLLIEKKCNIECEDNLERKPIHLACEKGHLEIVKLLIEKKCNIESKNLWELRPIHLACENGHIEIVKLLILLNCFINVNDKEGAAPMNLAKSKCHVGIVNLLSEFDKVTKQINDSILKNNVKSFTKFYKSDLLTGRNWLKMAWEQKADKIINYFLNRPIDVIEIGYIKTVINNRLSESTNSELWEEILLYKCIKDHREKEFPYIFKPKIINRINKIIQCSFLVMAAKYENLMFFQEIMKKTLYDNEIWKRTKEIAFIKGCHHIYNSISSREYLLKCRQNGNISILHTAICDNDPDMLEYILSEGLVDPNHSHEVLGTALSFAIMLCNRECLTIFERFNIDCNTQNKYFQSPLHEAISNGMIDHCQYLMDRVENINQPGFEGQTALHYAVIRECEELCEQLIEKGADCFRYMESYPTLSEKKGTPISKDLLQLSQRENSLTLCLKMNQTIYPCLLKSLDREKANSFDGEGNSLLHFSAKLMKSSLFKILLQAGANIDLQNKKGNTPLFELLSNLDQQSFIIKEDKIIETVNLFVQFGCDLNKSINGELSLFHIIKKFNCERLCLALLPRQRNQLLEIDENLLRIVLERHFYRFCMNLLELIPKKHLKSSISNTVIEEALKHDCTKLLKSLIINASDEVQQIMLELSLYHLAKYDDKDSFECLLNIEIKNPSRFDDGESLLTRLLVEEKLYFCRKIIKSKINKKIINFKNKSNQTPLQVAIETESMDIVLNHLVFETDIIDNMDCEGRTALIQLFVKVSGNTDEDRYSRLLNVIRVIICKGGNIYHKTSDGKEAIEFCCSTLVREEIETFQNNQINFTNPVREKKIEREKVVVVVKETEFERKTCGICLEREVDSVFECGHTICEVCSVQLFRCPFCYFAPARARRIYFN